MDIDKYEPGTPCWVELATSDTPAAITFYSQLLGWETQTSDVGTGMQYTLCTKNAKPAAGLYQQQPEQAAAGAPPAWLTHISVANVDETASKVESSGGTILSKPFDVMSMGRMALIADNSGAIVSLWQPADMQGAQIVNTAGALVWDELITSEPDKAKQFYADVIGWGVEETKLNDVDYTMFQVNGKTVAGMLARAEGSGPPPHWAVYFGIDDVDKAVEYVKAHGGSVYHEPMDLPYGRMAAIRDPQGASVAIVQLPTGT